MESQEEEAHPHGLSAFMVTGVSAVKENAGHQKCPQFVLGVFLQVETEKKI